MRKWEWARNLTVSNYLKVKGDLTQDDTKIIAKGTELVSATAATLTVTAALHAGKTVVLSRAAGIAVTLPEATGTGHKYRFIIGTTVTSNSTTIAVANADDSYVGLALSVDDDVEGATGFTWNAETNDDTVTMDGSATGGKAGDIIEIEDFANETFLVRAYLTQSGGSEATPFSATVS